MHNTLYDYAHAVLIYNPETGEFTHRVRRGGAEPGVRADIYHKSTGYRMLKLRKRRYYAHRIAWLMMTGQWPERQIDHINRSRQDNRWCNLRDVSNRENAANRSMWTGYVKSMGLLSALSF